ncbi:MAG: YihY/virulence factor BrkB family protein [Bryobacteraceae bacterium]
MARAITLLKDSYAKWSEHQAPRLGASVAFYSILSFAPLLVMITAVIAVVFGQQSAQNELIHVARQWIGEKGAETVQSLLINAQKPSSGIVATLIAFTTVLFGASGVFSELHDALNVIWEVPPKTDGGVLALIKDKLFSFGMVLSVGFLLLVSLILSAALAYVGHYFGELVPMPPAVLEVINFIVSIAVVAGLFALMFKYVPNAEVSWRNVRVGAIGTALLFTVGKFLLGMYLAKAGVGSPYGAAGSLVAVVVWIYYSAQIFFFGAEFTHVYAGAHAFKVKEPPVRAQSEPQGTASAEKSQAAAATVGSPSVTKPPLPTPAPKALTAQQSKPVNVISQEVIRQSEEHLTPNLPAVSGVQPKPKPQLLMAVGLGFVLGRAFDFVNARRHHRNGSGTVKNSEVSL